MGSLTRREFIALGGASLTLALSGCGTSGPAKLAKDVIDLSDYEDMPTGSLAIVLSDGTVEKYEMEGSGIWSKGTDAFFKHVKDEFKGNHVTFKEHYDKAQIVIKGYIVKILDKEFYVCTDLEDGRFGSVVKFSDSSGEIVSQLLDNNIVPEETVILASGTIGEVNDSILDNDDRTKSTYLPGNAEHALRVFNPCADIQFEICDGEG